MMRKFLSIKLILISFFLTPLNNNAEENLFYRGGIFISEITKYSHEAGFTFHNSKVLTYEKEGKFYLIFGIPYKSKIGKNTYLLKNGNKDYPVKFTINDKEYATQRISVAKKYTEPSEEIINRVIKEKKELMVARSKWIDMKVDLDFVLPVEGITTGVYGTRRFYNGKEGNYHNGLDIAAPIGTEIVAPSSGRVLLTGDYFYNGKFIYIDHGQNLKSIFIHLNKINVNVGDILKKGQIIGEVGSTGKSTGPHLHWSVTLNSVYVDPEIFINKQIF